MKSAATFIVFLSLGVNIHAQTFPLSVVSSDGGQAANGPVYWEWSLGESAIGTFSNGATLTEGFEQGDLISSSLKLVTPGPIAAEVKLLPNSSWGVLHLYLGNSTTNWTIQLFNPTGKSLERKSLALHGEDRVDLDISKYGNGLFFLKVNSEDHELEKTFNVFDIR